MTYRFNGYVNKRYIIEQQEELFAALFSMNIDNRTKVTSPLRDNDKSPGCIFRKKNGVMNFIDYADNPTHFNIIEFYARLYRISLESSELKLYNVIADGKVLEKVKFSVTLKNRKSGSARITYIETPWSRAHISYWEQYGLTKEQLEPLIKPISDLKYVDLNNRVDMVVSYRSVAFLIMLGEGKYKAYCPHSVKHKFITNVRQNTIGGLELLDRKKKYVVIEKSFKDWAILYFSGINCIWFQNEGMIPDDEILISQIRKFQVQLILFDGDEAGIKASEKLRLKLRQVSPKAALIECIKIEHRWCHDVGEFLETGKSQIIDTIKRMVYFSLFFNKMDRKCKRKSKA